MKNTYISKAYFIVGGIWLLIAGVGELTTQSQGATSYSADTSLLSLSRRSQGSLKIGLGLGLLGAASLGSSSNDNDKKASIREDSNEEEIDCQLGIADESVHKACLAIFEKNGKYGTPAYSKFIKGDTSKYVLLSKEGKELAIFKKKSSGEWAMPFWEN